MATLADPNYYSNINLTEIDTHSGALSFHANDATSYSGYEPDMIGRAKEQLTYADIQQQSAVIVGPRISFGQTA